MNTHWTLHPPRRARGTACHRRRRATLWFCLLAFAAPARAEWFYDARIAGLYDDNLTRAQQAADERADGAVTLGAGAGWFYAPSGNDGLTLSLEANSEAYARFHGLNLVSIGATAAYRHKFGLGYAAPWVSAAVSAAQDKYRGDIRDGDRFDAYLEFGRRLTESFDASAGVAIDRRRARNDRPVVPGISGRVFDLRGQSVFARAAYDITDRLQLGGHVSVRRGDVESTTRQNLDIFLASDAIAADPTFGSDFYAYRLRGTTQSARASLSWALSDRSSLNVSYAFAHTASYNDLVYRSRVGTIVLAYRY
ncbi:MAG TPA: hypothetical protein VGK37_01240 [Casimicrobiaceae bacterium]|jgi:hypothetical protein